MAVILSREEFAILKVQATGGGPVHTTELAFATIPTIEALAEALAFVEMNVERGWWDRVPGWHAMTRDLREKGWIE